MPTRITFNGTQSESPEAMPPAVRETYLKALEVARQGGAGKLFGTKVNVKLSTKMRFVHDGKTYESLDELPPELRATYQAVMQQVDKDGNGTPDFLESVGQPSADPQAAALDYAFDEPASPAIAPLASQPPVIATDQPRNRSLTVAGLVIILLLLVILGLTFYMSGILQH